MKPVNPPTELPDNVRPALFQPPPGLEESVNPLPGLVHLDPEGNPVGMEFMFEISKKELQVLRHEPYLTITFRGDALSPFALQTSYPQDEKYETLMEHHHICTANYTHDKNKFWRCDNPTHNTNEQKIRQCDSCFEHLMMLEEDLITDDDSVEMDEST